MKGEYMTLEAIQKELAKAIGHPVEITIEDHLRGAIVEACQYLREAAPSRALETLEQALQFKP